ncbi:hypothetical protein ACS0TY_013394 [Phlomoides rotata]
MRPSCSLSVKLKGGLKRRLTRLLDWYYHFTIFFTTCKNILTTVLLQRVES